MSHADRLPEVLGHGEVLAGLWRAERDQRLPHALLFEGPGGIGKFLSALRFTGGLFCASGPGEPCGACGPCRRLASGGEEANHPDLLVVDPSVLGEEEIPLGYIAYRESSTAKVPLRRTVEGFLDLKNQEASTRVVILREAHMMNPNAQNALLKTLEEPRPGTLLILTTSQASGLLDTVISRVTRVAFARLDAETTEVILRKNAPALSADDCARYARWGQGSPGYALDLVREQRAAQVELLSRVVRGELGPIAASVAFWKLDLEIVAKTERAKDRKRVRFVLDLALEWVLDLGRLEAGATGLVHEPELRAAVRGRDALRHLPDVRDRLIQARLDVESNLTPSAVLDSALLAMGKLAPAPPGVAQ
jgi:hypothetical protein